MVVSTRRGTGGTLQRGPKASRPPRGGPLEPGYRRVGAAPDDPVDASFEP
jgi:hypothetical protein